MYAAVVSYHVNPYTCGVARFNHSLAKALGIPLLGLSDYLKVKSPDLVLLSIKLEEVDSDTLQRLSNTVTSQEIMFDFFLHTFEDSTLSHALCKRAERLYASSHELAVLASVIRTDLITVFAPGAPARPLRTAVDCSLLTFGMAHKIRSSGYRKLAGIIANDKRTFRLEISTALHEGGTFDEHFFNVNREISSVFSGSVHFLGFLADSEVSERLNVVDALVAFFDRGVRENNTTVLSAMSHGCPVITNLDKFSPAWMVHGVTMFDIDQLHLFPQEAELRRVGESGMRVASEFNFERLAAILQEAAK